MTFEDLNLSEALISAVTEMGYENPTPIQEQTIPILLSGTKDYVGLAQTGTGKTAAFSLPLLDLIRDKDKYPQALILSPTRELCIQIQKEIVNFSKFKKGIESVAVYGGADIIKQIKDIKKGVQIVVATPGRLIDLASRKAIDLSKIDYIVLDEADEMLNMGFKDALDEILTYASNVKSTWLFSATMPSEVRRIAASYMTNPHEVTVGTKNAANVNIENIYYLTEHRNRMAALQRIIDHNPNIYGIVFCRTRMEAKDVAENLMTNGYNADALHGDLSQAQRDYVMKKFKSHNLSILVATDVAARGIDVDDITHVINYNLPDEIEVYTHRSGRTARAGKKGTSIIIMDPRDMRKLRPLEKIINQSFTQKEIPSAQEVCEIQLLNYAKTIKETEFSSQLEKFFPAFQAELEELSKEELIQKIAAINFERLLSYYKKDKDLNYAGKTNDKPDRRGDQARTSGGERFFITMGKKDGINVGELLQFIDKNTGVKGKEIGRIDLKDAFSFFEVEDKDAAKMIVDASSEGLYDGERKIKIEVAGAREGGGGSSSRNSGGFRGGNDRNRSGGGNRSRSGERDRPASSRSGGEGSRSSRFGGGSRSEATTTSSAPSRSDRGNRERRRR